MAALVLLRNPLAPHTREIHPIADGAQVIDWLQEHHPNGFGMPCRFYVNGVEKPLDDLDYVMQPDDVAVIATMPGIPATMLTPLLINLAISVALAGVSYLLNYFFQPKQKSGSKTKPISIYDVSSDQNAARVGEPIPVVYGNVITVPDYISQPYTFYTWSQANYDELFSGIQYLDMIMCVGQGNIDVNALYLGDTGSATPATGVVTWKAFKPADHRKVMGNIATSMGGGFHENVISSPEVSNQEFINVNDSAGFFATCKPGQSGSKFQIDIVFPGGMTRPNNSGDINGNTAQFTLYYQQLDDNDNLIGTLYSTIVTASSSNSTVMTGPDNTNITSTTVDCQNATVIGSPMRRSYMITAPSSGRWAVKIVRITAAPNAKNGVNRFIWAGLRLYADYPSGSAYGDVTLLAVRVKASLGMGDAAASRVRVNCTRRLPPPAGGSEAQSTSGADAFADAYTNAVYGAGRARSELDTATLAALRTKWAGYNFNYVFAEKTTVWEALRTITTPFAAEPCPVGPTMSVVQDGIKSTRSMLFTDANIVSDSLAVSYSFDEEGISDGIEIEYLDPKDFKQSYTRYPTTSLRPDQYTLPGVTNATHAAQYAQLAWQRRQGQRKKVTFDTELEGLLLQLGDRIGISHNVPKWGDGGLVIGVSGLNITVDHDLDWSGGTKQIMFRQPDGGVTTPVTVTRGTQDNIVVLPGSPATTIYVDADYDYTSFAFGDASTLVRDFTVTATTPTGDNTVTIEAVNYNASIFSGGMSFL